MYMYQEKSYDLIIKCRLNHELIQQIFTYANSYLLAQMPTLKNNQNKI